MAITKLPDGSYLDPEHSPVAAIFKQAPTPPLDKWAVVLITTKANFVVPCEDEVEADAQLGALAFRLGYSPLAEMKSEWNKDIAAKPQ
jgi:hypothetical protein